MSIFPLPVFEADADPHHRSAQSDQELYEQLESPKTIVVRFGRMKLVGEFRYEGDAKPGCGTKLVSRTHRGTELVEMLTTTCENAGCNKSVTRKEMLGYISASGGKDYPFHTNGRILRVATVEDLNKQSRVESETPDHVKTCKRLVADLGLGMKLVDAEPILGGELITFYYMSEKRVDFRELVRLLAAELRTRIEMRQVGARDEARLTADYERCGQYCCCKGFLKVLKPVSMRSAKVQKATLDPLKISGRCGRLMCCLRYEDQTYKELKARLPKRNSRVGTSEGPGVVVDSKILVQLVLVRLEHDGREIAVAVEDLMDPETCPRPEAEVVPTRSESSGRRGGRIRAPETAPADGDAPPERRRRRRRRRRRPEEGAPSPPAGPGESPTPVSEGAASSEGGSSAKDPGSDGAEPGRPRRRRRRRRGRRSRGGDGGEGGDGGGSSSGPA